MLKTYLLLISMMLLITVTSSTTYAQHDFSILGFGLDDTQESVERRCRQLGYNIIDRVGAVNNVDGSVNLVISCGHPNLSLISKVEVDYRHQKLKQDSKRLPVLIATELRYDHVSSTNRAVLYNFLYLEVRPYLKALAPIKSRRLCKNPNRSSGMVENYKASMWGIIAESKFDVVIRERVYTIELGRPGHNSSIIGNCSL